MGQAMLTNGDNRVSDGLTIFQLRPFLLGFFSAIFLDEPVNTVQKIAAGTWPHLRRTWTLAGISVFGEILLAKPTMLFSTAPPSEIIKSGPESITHSTPTQHFTSFGIIVLLLFFISFDLIAIRRLRGEVHAFLILALCSLAAVIITPMWIHKSSLTLKLMAGRVLLITRQPLILPSSATGWFLLGIVQVCHMYDPTDAQILGVMTQVLLAESLKRETANVMALVSQFQVCLSKAWHRRKLMMSFQVVPGAICEYLLFGSRVDALSGAGALLTPFDHSRRRLGHSKTLHFPLYWSWRLQMQLQRPQEDQPTLPTARDEGHLMSEMPLLEADDSEEEAKEPTSS